MAKPRHMSGSDGYPSIIDKPLSVPLLRFFMHGAAILTLDGKASDLSCDDRRSLRPSLPSEFVFQILGMCAHESDKRCERTSSNSSHVLQLALGNLLKSVLFVSFPRRIFGVTICTAVVVIRKIFKYLSYSVV